MFIDETTSREFDFPDGSAVVQSGEAWDLKGAGAFSWAGLE